MDNPNNTVDIFQLGPGRGTSFIARSQVLYSAPFNCRGRESRFCRFTKPLDVSEPGGPDLGNTNAEPDLILCLSVFVRSKRAIWVFCSSEQCIRNLRQFLGHSRPPAARSETSVNWKVLACAVSDIATPSIKLPPANLWWMMQQAGRGRLRQRTPPQADPHAPWGCDQWSRGWEALGVKTIS